MDLVQKITSFKWRPFSLMHCWRHSWKFPSTLQHLSVNSSDFLTNFILNASIFRGFDSFSCAFKYLHKNKSHIDKSGDLDGHRTSPCQEIRWAGNMVLRRAIEVLVVWAVALSCWNHIFRRFIFLLWSWGAKTPDHFYVTPWHHCNSCTILFKEMRPNY